VFWFNINPALYQIQITLSDPSLLGYDATCKQLVKS